MIQQNNITSADLVKVKSMQSNLCVGQVCLNSSNNSLCVGSSCLNATDITSIKSSTAQINSTSVCVGSNCLTGVDIAELKPLPDYLNSTNICIGGNCIGSTDLSFTSSLRNRVTINPGTLDISTPMNMQGVRVLPQPGLFTWLTDWGILRSAAAPHFCLDANGHPLNGNYAPVNGSYIYFWFCQGTQTQNWKFDGSLIKHQLNGLCLSLTNNDTVQPIQLWQCNSTSSAQLFSYSSQGTIVHTATGRVMSVGALAVNTRPTFATAIAGNTSQIWTRLWFDGIREI